MKLSDAKYARQNLATGADIEADALFARGAFKLVYAGEYGQGERMGEPCVCKVFESGAVYENSFFAHEMEVVEKALNLVHRFNEANLINRVIYLNKPEIWTCTEDSGGWAKQKALIEPMIANFEKFNSNTGWNVDDGIAWNQVMQALSHFSYHSTGGHFVLCDLQGGVYRDGVVLTDPVVMSRSRKYGPTDLGPEGITTFFARHVCNKYCRPEWTRPASRAVHFDVKQGTSMIMPVPTRPSRAAMTRLG